MNGLIWLAPLALAGLIIGAIRTLSQGYADLGAMEEETERMRKRAADRAWQLKVARNGGYTGSVSAEDMPPPPTDVPSGAMRECPRCGLLVRVGQRWCDGSGEHE